MEKNQALLAAAVIFGIVALLHLTRAILGWSLVIENFDVPAYFSIIVAVFLGYLSWSLFNLSKR